jgi:hypothetical protein
MPIKKLLFVGILLLLANSNLYAAQELTYEGEIIDAAALFQFGRVDDIIIKLKEHPGKQFMALVVDAPAYGLSKINKVSSNSQLKDLLNDLDKVKGWKVIIKCTESDVGILKYFVKSLKKVGTK